MSKYIPAEKLIAEVERRKKQDVTFRERSILIDIETAIASLQQEQPEVDFEKAYKSYMKSRKDDLYGNAITVNIKDLARHFYELGKARKEK